MRSKQVSVVRAIRTLRSTWRTLETWHGRDAVTLATERARQQGTQTSTYTGAPVFDPTCEGGEVRFLSATRLVVGFEYEADARRFWDALRARLEEFALSLHPDKTRLIEFGRHAADRRARAGLGKPETFKFLGFLFICGKSRRGKFLVHRKSRRDRMRAKLQEVKKELRKRMHRPIPEQGRWLAQVVRGYFAYHAVPTNGLRISAFRHFVVRFWLRTLRRRSQKDRFSWERIKRLADDFLPQPRTLHPWPSARFAVKHSR